MTYQNQVRAWRVMSFIWLAGFLAMLALSMAALSDRDDARRIRASMGVTQLNCTPVSQAGNQRQRSPHEQEPDPTPATAPGRWDEERYSL
ncbi:hypothetical protein V0R50_10355 [Pseudomonas sp. 148P]|uniref:Secreted protein n=1 Tax=Pseudomonas ulcerans TaxID=3115852 RepID=A0ABU7HQ17_9PSED|nr:MULTISPECIES: hypothetical protein [unclassified Pseudomonas]MEE1922645.1 hypothetical protein [Pseudomonas sp. 147P]MEE1933622.1 hypothetical protein [Pseudomonas sp. 148P]